MKKIVLIHNIITPTRTTLFNEMYKHFAKMWYAFSIIFLSRTESNRERDTQREENTFLFPYTILWSKVLMSKSWKDRHFFHINTWIQQHIKDINPDIIIHAWRASLSAYQLCRRAKKHNKQFILRSWSTKHEKSRRRTITKPLVKRLIKNSSSYRSYGTRAAEYLISLWAPSDKIYKLYNTVDIKEFVKEYEERKDNKSKIKEKWWVKESFVFLFVWRIEKTKWIREMIYAFRNFSKRNKNVSLMIVGSGREWSFIKNYLWKNNIKNIHWVWYKQKDEIFEYYAWSDCLILPSYHEVWWLVINEAMCFWLPIITRETVGASIDLVDKTNWVIIKGETTQAIWMAYQELFKKKLDKKNSSLNKIKEFNIQKIVSWIKVLNR